MRHHAYCIFHEGFLFHIIIKSEFCVKKFRTTTPKKGILFLYILCPQICVGFPISNFQIPYLYSIGDLERANDAELCVQSMYIYVYYIFTLISQ